MHCKILPLLAVPPNSIASDWVFWVCVWENLGPKYLLRRCGPPNYSPILSETSGLGSTSQDVFPSCEVLQRTFPRRPHLCLLNTRPWRWNRGKNKYRVVIPACGFCDAKISSRGLFILHEFSFVSKWDYIIIIILNLIVVGVFFYLIMGALWTFTMSKSASLFSFNCILILIPVLFFS